MTAVIFVKGGSNGVVFAGTADAASAAASAAAAGSAATTATTEAGIATAAAASAAYPVGHILGNAPPGYAVVVTDSAGRFPGGVTDQGVLQFSLMQALLSFLLGTDGSGFSASAPGAVASAVDSSGRMAWFVGEDGTVNAGVAKIGTLNGVDSGQLQLLSQPTPQKAIIPAQIIAAVSDGQSLSYGTNCQPALSTSTRFTTSGGLMLKGGIRPWETSVGDELSALVAMVERNDSADNAGETPQAGFSEFLNELLWKENGLRPSDHGMQAAVVCPGQGATTIANHQSGTSLYTRHHTEAAAIKTLATSAGKTCKKLFTSWRLGESDGGNASYAANLVTLRNSDAADTKTEFSQTDELYYICYQCPRPDIALQFYLATKLSPYIKIANPIHWMSRYSDGVHFDNIASRWDGAYHALMFKRLFVDGRKWNAVRPFRDVDGNIQASRSGNQVTLTFDVPSGGQLKFDPASCYLGEARQFGHYLYAADGVTEQTVTNIEIIGRNVVRLTCSSAVPANCIWRYGYTDPTSHAIGAVNGNMRDNQGDWLRYDGLTNAVNKPMHNWAIAFEETIA